MAYERKPGEFSLNKNDKGDNPKRPDYRGDGVDLNGNPIEIAAWIKDGPKGKWMSCTMKPKEAKQQSAPRGNSVADMESDIPFSPLRKVESSLL